MEYIKPVCQQARSVEWSLPLTAVNGNIFRNKTNVIIKMKKLLFFSLLFLGPTSNLFSQSGWTELTNPTDQPYFGVYFLSSSIGFVCGANGVLLRTSNGGDSWDIIQLNPDILFYKIGFKDANTGFVIGSFGVAYKTEDTGMTWAPILPVNGILSLHDIFFLDNNYGLIVGRRGVALDSALIMRTTDGGNTWPILDTPFPNQLFAVSFHNYFDGFAVGDNNLRIKTINSGQTWSALPNDPPALFFDVSAVSSSDVFAVSTNGIYLSTNAGQSWNLNFTGGYLQTVTFLNSSTGFAGGRDGRIWKTTNSGTNWLSQQLDFSEEIMDIFFVDNDTGYAVGNKNNQGIIYKTTTGGNSTSGVSEFSSEIPDEFFVYQNYPNPFNPSTTIHFSIPEQTFVKLEVFNTLGEKVTTLVSEELFAGNYRYEWDATNLTSGVYLYKMQTTNFSTSKKMIFLK